jgi:hypothetical protein
MLFLLHPKLNLIPPESIDKKLSEVVRVNIEPSHTVTFNLDTDFLGASKYLTWMARVNDLFMFLSSERRSSLFILSRPELLSMLDIPPDVLFS